MLGPTEVQVSSITDLEMSFVEQGCFNVVETLLVILLKNFQKN